jgi:hypothetical protein
MTETRPDFFFFFIFSARVIFLRTHLADLLFADRRSGDSFATAVAAAGQHNQKDGP